MAQPESGRPHKLTERYRRVLKSIKILCPWLQHPLPSSKLPLEATSAQEPELHEMGFHGRAAAHKPKITLSNAKRRLEWCKAPRHQTIEQWKRVLWSDESRFESGFAGCQNKAASSV